MSTIRWRGTALLGLGIFVVGCDPCCGDPDCRKSTSGGTGTTSGGTTTSTTKVQPGGPVRTAPVFNQGPRNGLLPCALWKNKDLLGVLRTSPLTTATADRPEVQSRLADEDTRGLLQYVVSCANDPDAPPVSPTLPSGVATTDRYAPPWRGEMGLCGRASPYPWGASGPSRECQELVSACVLARVNKIGARVMISTRGEDAALFPMMSEIPVQTSYRDDSVVGATRPCSGGATECGFRARRVGMCATTAGSTEPRGPNGRVMVTIKATAAAPGTTLRVCKGLHGCAPGGVGATHYSDWIADSSGTAPTPSLTFECPGNGPRVAGARQGYYSVLVKGADVDVTATNGSYPASETQVFTYREGAFFGNIFDTAALARPGAPEPCATSGRALGGHEIACFSEIWSDGEAHYTDRWCAGSPCFDNTPKPCLFEPRSTTVSASKACEDQSAGPQPFYRNGRGGADDPASFRWKHPITVYLNHPCDTVSEKSLNCPGWPEQGPDAD